MRILTDLGIIQVPIASLHIREDIQSWNVFRNDAEIEALRSQIIREGEIRDPVIVWRRGSDNILVDGFTRIRIAKDAGWSSVKAYLAEFNDDEEVRVWITLNQNTRRNLSDVQKAYQIGRLYNTLKTADDIKRYMELSGNQMESMFKDKDADRVRSVLLARYFNINEKSVRRYGLYARGLDRVMEINLEEWSLLLRGLPVNGKKVSQTDIQRIGQLGNSEFKRLKAGSVLDVIKKMKGADISVGQGGGLKEINGLMRQFIKQPDRGTADAIINWIESRIQKDSDGEEKVLMRVHVAN